MFLKWWNWKTYFIFNIIIMITGMLLFCHGIGKGTKTIINVGSILICISSGLFMIGFIIELVIKCRYENIHHDELLNSEMV